MLTVKQQKECYIFSLRQICQNLSTAIASPNPNTIMSLDPCYLADLQTRMEEYHRRIDSWEEHIDQILKEEAVKPKVWVQCHKCVYTTFDDRDLKEHIDKTHSKTSWPCNYWANPSNDPSFEI